MEYGNNFRSGFPSTNNLWVGNNYSSGYSQMSRNNYPMVNGNNNTVPQTINNVLQVMGPESAQAFQVGPNSNVILMDSNRAVFYTKRSDDSGYSETKAWEFKEIPLFPATETNQLEPTNANTTYVSRTEFDEFKKMIEELVMKSE